MKKLLFIGIILFASFSFAQTVSQEEINVIQDLFGSEKKAIFEDNVNLSNTNADAFWKLYNEYENQRKAVGQEKVKLLERYTSNTKISEDQVDDMMKKAMTLRASSNNLIGKYYKKMKKATNPMVAAQFYQIEHYISDGISFSILDNINFIQDK